MPNPPDPDDDDLDDELDAELDDSFPASDPPSLTEPTGQARKRRREPKAD